MNKKTKQFYDYTIEVSYRLSGWWGSKPTCGFHGAKVFAKEKSVGPNNERKLNGRIPFKLEFDRDAVPYRDEVKGTVIRLARKWWPECQTSNSFEIRVSRYFYRVTLRTRVRQNEASRHAKIEFDT